VGILDRAIGLAEKIAPEWGLKRATARARLDIINSAAGGVTADYGSNGFGYGHHGASHSKTSLRGWRTQLGGPDADITANLGTLRERSRDLCMGEALAIGALKTIRSNEVGAGLRLNAQIDARYLGMTDEEALAWEDCTEREFAIWADSKMCDAARRCTFGELQALARLSQLMSGDVFALLPAMPRPGERYDLRIQLLEADRVCDPIPRPVDIDLLGGVEVGEHGEPVAYHVIDIHPGDLGFPGQLRLVRMPKWQRIPAFGAETGRPIVLHLMESDRPGQRRGVPLLAPVMEKLKQLSRYSHAELMAAVVSGMFTAAITSERPSAIPGQVIPSQQQIPDSDPNTYQLGNGAVLGLLPGEKLEAINPGRPNSGFEPFVIAVCRQIGAGLGIPYELLVMQFTSSYSASRGALLEAWKRFTVGRTWLAAGFCQPIYEAWLEEAVARGIIDAPGFFSDPMVRAAWCGAEWHGPTQGQLDPTKEAEAAKMRVDEGFSTRTRETAELTGGNWERFHTVRVREERLRREGDVVPAAPGAPAPTANSQTEAA
jgi:lambda family phage portal protein